MEKQTITDKYSLYNADCIELMQQMPGQCVDMSIFSPPYLSLYTYSAESRDLGNSRTDKEFYEHFQYVVNELFRIVKDGRIVAVDVMNVPAMKGKDGYIGLKDFRGEVIRMFIEKGFIFHSEHCCWKDPLLEATRTKAIGLMHKQLCKDSTMCRAGIPQYLLAFRKPGDNKSPVAHENGIEYFIGENPPVGGSVMSHEIWRKYASPVWMDINFTRTLNYMAARDNEDERHISPLALDIIERAVFLWSNENDIVFSPFAGIGSEGYGALQQNRRFIGVELKESYYKQAIKNLETALLTQSQLF